MLRQSLPLLERSLLLATRGAASRCYSTAREEFPPLSLSSVWPESFVNNDVVRAFQASLSNLTEGKWHVDVSYGQPKDQAIVEVKKGNVAMTVGHSTYWKGMAPASAFFASIPFGMYADEFAAWISFGGGKELWERHYQPHGLIPIMAGDTGMQMGGWFKERMSTTEQFKGLRMRIEGLGGPTLSRVGMEVVDAPASKLVPMLRDGDLDACEFATPSMDLAAGLPELAVSIPEPLIYHYPGWHQPSAVFEFLLNADYASQNLSPGHISLIEGAAREAAHHFYHSLLATNQVVLDQIMASGVAMHTFPVELLKELQPLAQEAVEEHVAGDAFSVEVKESYMAFLSRMRTWGQTSAARLWEWRR